MSWVLCHRLFHVIFFNLHNNLMRQVLLFFSHKGEKVKAPEGKSRLPVLTAAQCWAEVKSKQADPGAYFPTLLCLPPQNPRPAPPTSLTPDLPSGWHGRRTEHVNCTWLLFLNSEVFSDQPGYSLSLDSGPGTAEWGFFPFVSVASAKDLLSVFKKIGSLPLSFLESLKPCFSLKRKKKNRLPLSSAFSLTSQEELG